LSDAPQPGLDTAGGSEQGLELGTEAPGGRAATEQARPSAARRPRDWLREQRKLPRRRLITAAAVATVLFLVLSVLLARYLAVENTERDDVLAVLRAQAAGDANGVIERISGCAARPGCVAQARQNAVSMRRSGSVKILSLTSHSAYSLTGATAPTRVAWTVIGRLPIVQCVTVRRTGNFLSGLSVELLSVSAAIPNEGDC
jgi:hypothetical protein